MAETVNPPKIAGVVLSGCPSILQAKLINVSWSNGLPNNSFAPVIPATMQAELLPIPLAIGILFS